MGRWIATALAALIAAFLVLGVDSVEPDATGDPAAARALVAVTTASFDPQHPAAAFPADWQAVMGYLPETARGPHGTPILIKPTGDCSSPLGPTEYNFAVVCKEHDLSYDVLRYSGRIGAALPASSRRAADDMFGRELHARCDQLRLTGWSYGTCHLLAESFVDVVRVNSWRQGYRPPGRENDWQLLSIVLLALGLTGVRGVHRFLGRRAAAAFGYHPDLPPGPAGSVRALLERLLPGLPGVPSGLAPRIGLPGRASPAVRIRQPAA
ncbi:MAG TPA: phospholipase A2 [Nakamurella sp.]|nr:phospholipase A2 [Nakamurella sp.]